MTHPRWTLRLRLCSLAFPVLMGAACDGSGGDGTLFETRAGASVVTPAVDAIVAKSAGGGLVGPGPQGGACDPQVWSFTFVLSGELTWSRCLFSGTGATSEYTPSTGTRTLTATERDAARAAANAVKVSSRNICGADKPSLSVEVRAGESSKSYGDDFYACVTPPQFDHFVESQGLDNLGQMLTSLAHE
jgi:hypothetical protein